METKLEAAPKMFKYGIGQEVSDVRAHVGVCAKRIYAYETKAVQVLVAKHGERYAKRAAFQKGVDYATGFGWTIPTCEIPGIREAWLPDYDWSLFGRYQDVKTTSEKGAEAVKVVIECLRLGKLPLWFNGITESECAELQIQGADLLIACNKKIQIKCDWFCGRREIAPGCTGNLFIQEKEMNPKKAH